MEQSLPILNRVNPAPTCVWSDAGVLAFRLCDRAFACDRCPLDAALRGDPRLTLSGGPGATGHGHVPWTFPTDRLYSQGHVWVQVIHPGRARAGIDACAAWLLPPVLAPRAATERRVVKGDPLCVLGVGSGDVTPPAPITGILASWNDRLESSPELLTDDPYGAGWIAELEYGGSAQLDSLGGAEDAAQSARLAARRFGRQAAFGLLSAAETVWVDQGMLEATQRAVGPAAYLAIVRDCLR